MTGQQLKNSILQMAVQGKLVPQDPNDEPASVLLERIRKEKEQLIKEGKIKKEKNPSYIFRGADNLPYEKVGKNEPVCIADEVPFEIPESWEWARIGSLFSLQAGKNISASKINEVEFPDSYPCYGGNGIRGYVNVQNHNGDYPIIGRQGALCGNIKRATGKFYATEHAVCVSTFANTDITWVCFFLTALNLNQYATATAQPGLSVANINRVLFPVPPIAEQERITARLLKVLPMVDAYGVKEKALQDYNKDFPAQLKKSILQEAVQGKLVPQDPADEPASVLLERIRAEKKQLIKAGKIKRDKHESVIFRRDNSHYEKLDGVERCIDNELPFEIPETWEWVRLGTVFQHNTGKALNASNRDGEKLTYITTSNLYWDRFVLDNLKTMPFTDSEVDKCTVQQGDLLVCEGGDIGRAAIWESATPMRIQNHIHRLRAYVPVCTRFFYHLFYLYKGAGWIGGKGIAIQGLSSNAIHNLLFPLPPLHEQERIVSAIDTALSVVQKL